MMKILTLFMMTENEKENKIENLDTEKKVDKPLVRKRHKNTIAKKRNIKRTEPSNSKRQRKRVSGGVYDCENFISDIFEKIRSSGYRDHKVEVLKKYSYLPALESILIAGFDNSLENAVDTKLVNLNNGNRNRNDGHLYLKDEYVNLYMFFKGGLDEISPEEKLVMLTKWMNSLHPDETNLLFSIFEKNMDKDYRLSKPIIKEVYPNIVWGNRGPIKEEEKKEINQRKPIEENPQSFGMSTLNNYLGVK